MIDSKWRVPRAQHRPTHLATICNLLLAPASEQTISFAAHWTAANNNYNTIKKTKIVRYKFAHMYSMIGVYVGALLIAGAFTLMPGRFFHEILFG